MAELKTVALDKIRVPDVRVSSILNPEQQALMASTIKEIGVVQDIVVRDLGAGEYELVAGKGDVAGFPRHEDRGKHQGTLSALLKGLASHHLALPPEKAGSRNSVN